MASDKDGDIKKNIIIPFLTSLLGFVTPSACRRIAMSSRLVYTRYWRAAYSHYFGSISPTLRNSRIFLRYRVLEKQ